MREHTESKHFISQKSPNQYLDATTRFIIKQLLPASLVAFILTVVLIIFINAVGSVLIDVISPELLTALIIMTVMPMIVLFYFLVEEIRMRSLKEEIGQLGATLAWRDIERDFLSEIENNRTDLINSPQQDA